MGGLWYNAGEFCTYMIQSTELFSVTVNYFWACDMYLFVGDAGMTGTDTMFDYYQVIRPELGKEYAFDGRNSTVFVYLLAENN